MKILIIINEDFSSMKLGNNASLAYILAAIDLGFDVYIHNLEDNFAQNNNAQILAINLNKKQKFSCELIKKYQELNQKITKFSDNLEQLQFIKVKNFLPQNLTKTKIKLSDLNFIIQRLEPMKYPFPPQGKANIDDILQQIKKIFPNFIFNCPIKLHDKKAPLKINDILQRAIATPTFEFSFNDSSLSKAFCNAKKFYNEIYQKQKLKLVIKPLDSAQSLGVFAIEFDENGLNLSKLQKKSILSLKSQEIYQIQPDLDQKQLENIIKLLCFVQNSAKNCNLHQINAQEVNLTVKRLYGTKILVQPFIHGISQGDIRINLLKDQSGNFYQAGQVFRKSLHQNDNNFTTTYSSGGSISQKITNLSEFEQKNLQNLVKIILKILNNDLKNDYKNSLELGLDFMLVGNKKDLLLGEINHHCPALLPVSEAIHGLEDKNYKYGLGLTKRAIKDCIKMQETC